MPLRPVSWPSILLVFVLSLGYALGLQQLMRPLTADGVHFHPWSSEDMMQTVSLRDLRLFPLQSLAHIHIQPPGFDAIRAALSQLWPTLSDAATLLRVDLALDILGGILLGLMVTVTYAWLAEQAGVAAGILGALLVLLHPASILFATFLDSTLLSAFLFLCSCYLLWRLASGKAVSPLLFSIAALALFFTRSIFQWPALLLFAVSLWLIRAPRRQLVVYVLIAGVISTLYLVKQYTQFGIFATSSFSGVSLANSIGVGFGTAKYAAYLDNPSLPTSVKPGMPDVLSARTKLDGQPNFNHIDYLSLNRQLSRRYVQALESDSVSELIRNYSENAAIYFRPSSSYSSGHVIVEHLPWRSAFDRAFSGPILPALLTLALALWSVRAFQEKTFAKGLGMLLPGLFVMLVSILADKGENMRFKFFVEPAMIVFLVAQAFALPDTVRRGCHGRPQNPPLASTS